MGKAYYYISIIILLIWSSDQIHAQESVFTGLKRNITKAEAYYHNGHYHEAIEYYLRLEDKIYEDKDIALRLADAYFKANEMSESVLWFDRYLSLGGQLRKGNILDFAYALQASGEIEKSIHWYKNYLTMNGEDLEISKKIWQMQNIHFLLEDSLDYKVIRCSFNTSFDEIGPAISDSSLIFASNKPTIQIIKRTEGTSQSGFFRWYRSRQQKASEKSGNNTYGTPSRFGTEMETKLHQGRISFFPGGDTIVFVRTSLLPNQAEEYNTQIFFAYKDDGSWQELGGFPHNNNAFNFNHPFLSPDGKTLYFSSDMPGGHGGDDLYQSHYINNQWTKPVNLGKEINTTQNEGHPFVLDETLYFSSNGHPGIGGLDIFSVSLKTSPLEIRNLGYPVNTHFDDFDLILNKEGTFGYFVSNRFDKNESNDDIFELHIKKITFPLTVKGKIRFKRQHQMISDSNIVLLSNASLELIDQLHNQSVYNTTTDVEGNFSLEVPYESQFLLEVKQKQFGTAVVSMEIPGSQTDYVHHDIVIVEDLFKTLQE